MQRIVLRTIGGGPKDYQMYLYAKSPEGLYAQTSQLSRTVYFYPWHRITRIEYPEGV